MISILIGFVNCGPARLAGEQGRVMKQLRMSDKASPSLLSQSRYVGETGDSLSLTGPTELP